MPQAALTPDALAQMLARIFADPPGLARRATRAHALATPNAAGRLADVVDELVLSSDRKKAA
jgi:UDP-N-acetylglucosamine:LPS N-acetylglucosamine transferase